MSGSQTDRMLDAVVRNLPLPEVERLAAYNGEVWRGLTHTDEYRAQMAELQARFDHMMLPMHRTPAPKRRWWQR